MHAASVLTKYGLRHKRGIVACPERDLLNDEAVRHNAIGHGQSVRVAEINLVLARANFVVTILDMNAHVLQRKYRVSPKISRLIQRGKIEVPAGINDIGALIVCKIEILKFRPNVECEAFLLCSLEISFEDVPGIPLIWPPRRFKHVTDDSRDALFFWPPGQYRKGAGIRLRNHI